MVGNQVQPKANNARFSKNYSYIYRNIECANLILPGTIVFDVTAGE